MFGTWCYTHLVHNGDILCTQVCVITSTSHISFIMASRTWISATWIRDWVRSYQYLLLRVLLKQLRYTNINCKYSQGVGKLPYAVMSFTIHFTGRYISLE